MSENISAQKPATEVADLSSSTELGDVMTYIAEREQNLSKYSDKLRASVQKIFQQFNSDICRECGENSQNLSHRATTHCKGDVYRDESKTFEAQVEQLKDAYARCGCGSALSNEENAKRTAEQLASSIEELRQAHEFIAGIDVSFNLIDPVAFRVDETALTVEYRLCIKNTWFCIAKSSIDKDFDFDLDRATLLSDVPGFDVPEPNRETLKALISSARIPKFLRYVAEQVKAKEQEYEQVSELAEKLASVF